MLDVVNLDQIDISQLDNALSLTDSLSTYDRPLPRSVWYPADVTVTGDTALRFLGFNRACGYRNSYAVCSRV